MKNKYVLSYRQLITQHFITKIACAKSQQTRPSGETALLCFMSKDYTADLRFRRYTPIFKRLREHGVGFGKLNEN